jgi:hypothetical protein
MEALITRAKATTADLPNHAKTANSANLLRAH